MDQARIIPYEVPSPYAVGLPWQSDRHLQGLSVVPIDRASHSTLQIISPRLECYDTTKTLVSMGGSGQD